MDVLDPWRKQLVGLGNAIRNGDTASIPRHVKDALDAGATREDIQQVVEFIIGDEGLLRSILILKEALDFEGNIRRDYISLSMIVEKINRRGKNECR